MDTLAKLNNDGLVAGIGGWIHKKRNSLPPVVNNDGKFDMKAAAETFGMGFLEGFVDCVFVVGAVITIGAIAGSMANRSQDEADYE